MLTVVCVCVCVCVCVFFGVRPPKFLAGRYNHCVVSGGAVELAGQYEGRVYSMERVSIGIGGYAHRGSNPAMKAQLLCVEVPNAPSIFFDRT